MIERWITAYLDYWHGHGDEHQYRYYRCDGCKRLVTWKAIRNGGCGCGMSIRVRPAVLTFGDKVRCLFLPWSLAR